MEPLTWLRRVGIAALVLLTALPATAQPVGRLRPDTDEMRQLIFAGVRRSVTFAAAVRRLDASDLIVEVQCGYYRQSSRLGRTVLLTARPGVRYVLVEMACGLTPALGLQILGHELRHAVEIADAPWVVDEPSLGRYYAHIGFSTCAVQKAGHGEFETADALEAGDRVHHELSHPDASTRPIVQVTAK